VIGRFRQCGMEVGVGFDEGALVPPRAIHDGHYFSHGDVPCASRREDGDLQLQNPRTSASCLAASGWLL